MSTLSIQTGCFLLSLATPFLPTQEPESVRSEEEAPRGLISRTDAASEGYTLFAPLRSQTTSLINLDGEIVHQWESDCSPGNSAYLQPNGDLIRCGRLSSEVFRGGGQGGKVQRISWEGELRWELNLSNDQLMAHHDIAVLPNENILVIAWEYKSPEAARSAGRIPSQISSKGFWPDMVLEYQFDEEGSATVVWEWHAFDHLVQDENKELSNYGAVAEHPELIDINGDLHADPSIRANQNERETELEKQRKRELEERMRALGYTGGDDEDDEEEPEQDEPSSGDWLHTNSIDYDPELDLIVLSPRTFSEVWIIDHSTTTDEARSHLGGRHGRGGDLLFRLGNPAASRQPGEQRLFKQHDAQFLGARERGLGVLVFNNGEGRTDGAYSTVDEFTIPFDEKTGFGKTRAELTWQYKAKKPESFFASFVSGSQRLPNGNTLICHGVLGQLIEVNRAGETVWEYHNPFAGDQPLEAGGGPGRGGPPRGGPRPNGERPGPPPGGDRAGPPPHGGPPNGRGSRMLRHGMFRATRLSKDHPALAQREL